MGMWIPNKALFIETTTLSFWYFIFFGPLNVNPLSQSIAIFEMSNWD